MWSSLHWLETFFIPTPTLTSSQMETKKGSFWIEKQTDNNMKLPCLSYAGQLEVCNRVTLATGGGGIALLGLFLGGPAVIS